jgi:hypothetical protein
MTQEVTGTPFENVPGLQSVHGAHPFDEYVPGAHITVLTVLLWTVIGIVAAGAQGTSVAWACF